MCMSNILGDAFRGRLIRMRTWLSRESSLQPAMEQTALMSSDFLDMLRSFTTSSSGGPTLRYPYTSL